MGIEQKVMNDIKNSAIVDIQPNVFYYDRPESQTGLFDYIRFFILDEKRDLYYANKHHATVYHIRVDIMATNDYTALSDVVVRTLEKKNYHLIDTDREVYVKGDIKIYNKSLIFTFTKYL